MQDDLPKRSHTISASQGDVGTPTSEVVSAGRRLPVTVIDELGRPIKVKYLTLLDHMRITRILGAELSKNDQYKSLASLAFCVVEFDGDVTPPPSTVRECEAMIDRLGDEGARAVGAAYDQSGWIRKSEDEDGFETAKN